MAKHTVKVSPYIHGMGLHEIGEQSKVAELVHDWIKDSGEEDINWSQWMGRLKTELANLGTLPEFSLAPSSSKAATKIKTIIRTEYRHPSDMERGVLSLRGHLFTDEALEALANLFPNPEEKLQLLHQARDHDVAAWKKHLRSIILQSNDLSTFINALAVYYGHSTFSDIREDYFLEHKLESLGVDYQKFVFRWSGNLESIVLEPEFIEWFKQKYDMASDAKLNERFDNMVSIKGTAVDGTVPAMSDLEIKEAKKSVERFRTILTYGFEKSKMNPSDFFNLTVSEAMQVDPSLIPIKISGSAAKGHLGSQYQWPDVDQLNKLCAEFKKASEANPRDKWFDSPYFSPRDKFNPASGKPYSEGLNELYELATKAREQLIAIGKNETHEGKGGKGR